MRLLCVAVLSLLAAARAAPVHDCARLTEQLEIQERDEVLGRWISIAESTDIPVSNVMTRMFVDSSWVKLTAANESDSILFFQALKSLGQCFTLQYNMTLTNSTLSMVKPLKVSEVLLKTSCPDCLVIHSKYHRERNSYRALQLLSRRNNISAAEIYEYNKQVQCLNLPPPAVLDPQKALCPEEAPSQDTQDRDLSSVVNEMGPELFNVFDSLMKKEDGADSLMKLIYHSLIGGKGN
ncbi:uncharacterized protein LOC130527124 [Takifugu flavidus]|uniref:Apolipoprotein M n=1 Tax=Takifugu flavidus TaxID=433684 RepID=A0A5C6N0P5_9TELE|nr:uncharacterized protein LOC130527124 [Takifugu flavidus]TWW59851.1 hypothetical protein D4764_06G0013810 [Takifugu flavidus]